MRKLYTGALMTLLALTQVSANASAGNNAINDRCPQLANCTDTEPCPNLGTCPNNETSPPAAPERQPTVVIPEPTALVSKDSALATAYYDTMGILRANNRCSMFFGGAEASVHVFSNFMEGIRKEYLPSAVGLKMSGDYINVLNAQTNLKFRLFERASLNSGGPFYQQHGAMVGKTIPGIGSFRPNSREARVLMLLHELGHLMKGTDQNWLLPDDGDNMEDSFRNTRRIESVCGDEIRSLSKHDNNMELARQNNLAKTVSPAAATSSHQ